jgi:hypothetical protein
MTASPAATSEMDQLDQLEGLRQRREQQKQITTEPPFRHGKHYLILIK